MSAFHAAALTIRIYSLSQGSAMRKWVYDVSIETVGAAIGVLLGIVSVIVLKLPGGK